MEAGATAEDEAGVDEDEAELVELTGVGKAARMDARSAAAGPNTADEAGEQGAVDDTRRAGPVKYDDGMEPRRLGVELVDDAC